MCSGIVWASLLIDQLPMPVSTMYLGVMHSFEFSCQWKERPLVQLLQSTLRSPSFNLSRNLQWVICKNQAVPRRVRNPGETGSNKTIKFKSLKKTQLWKNRAGPLPYLSPSSWVLCFQLRCQLSFMYELHSFCTPSTCHAKAIYSPFSLTAMMWPNTLCAPGLSGAQRCQTSGLFSATPHLTCFCSTADSPAVTRQVLDNKPPFHFIEAGFLHDFCNFVAGHYKVHWKYLPEARLSSLWRFGAAMLNYESALLPLAHWNVVWAADNSTVWNQTTSFYIAERYKGKQITEVPS